MVKIFFKRIRENPHLFFVYTKLGLYYLREILKDEVARIVFFLRRKSYLSKNIWLISERKDEACDNGYFLFKYLREKHPEINVYYCILKKSPQNKKLCSLGNIIKYDSIRNYIYAYAAAVRMSTMDRCPAPALFASSFCGSKIKNRINKIRKQSNRQAQIVLYLQHGVIYSYLNWFKNYRDNSNITDYVMCSAKREIDFLENAYSYPSFTLPLVGLCRWDNLTPNASPNKFILVIPTWRNYIEKELNELPFIGFMNKKAKKNRINRFKQTSYYKDIASLLNELIKNEQLINSKYNIILYLHPNFQKFSSAFEEFSQSKILIKTKSDSALCDLIRDSDILITDFSSVAFDAAYAYKPIIYYQYDENKFYENQYPQGYFSFKKDGFGKVVYSLKDVSSELDIILKNRCLMSEKYKQRVNNFFMFHDQNNCERTYNFIKHIINSDNKNTLLNNR